MCDMLLSVETMFNLIIKLLWDTFERNTEGLKVNAWCSDSVKGLESVCVKCVCVCVKSGNHLCSNLSLPLGAAPHEGKNYPSCLHQEAFECRMS